mgnify:CR=1 FL=1
MKPWLFYALLSAVSAAFVSIFGKMGLAGLDSNAATAVRAVIMAAFLVVRYRRWPAWLFLVGSGFAGLVMTAAAFRILGGGDYDLLGTVLLIGSFFISPPLCTMLAVWLAKQLERAGIGRDLRLAEDRRARR